MAPVQSGERSMRAAQGSQTRSHPILKIRSNMSKTFVITPKNYPLPLEVLGEHAAVLASGADEWITTQRTAAA